MKQHTVGIDISKAHLDAHRLADGHSAQFDNDPAGFRALIDWIGTPVECVAYEAAASLAGLAAVPRESGTWQGRAFIRGGRARARRLLYMPAVAALRWNPDLAEVNRRLSERGKPGKVALVAVMRKLIVLANTLVRQDRTWLPVAPRATF